MRLAYEVRNQNLTNEDRLNVIISFPYDSTEEERGMSMFSISGCGKNFPP